MATLVNYGGRDNIRETIQKVRGLESLVIVALWKRDRLSYQKAKSPLKK
jgi:hypothetical protein